MPAALAPIIAYFGSAGAAAAVGGTAAAEGAAVGAGTAAAAGGAAIAGETAVGASVAAAGGIAAGVAAPVLPGIAAGVGDVTAGAILSGASTAATGVSALATLARGAPNINVPPSPQFQTQDATVAQAGQQALQRAQAAGGLQSTTGTPGGQAGSVLNPTTLSSKTLLGG
jgi:hypothetical protein